MIYETFEKKFADYFEKYNIKYTDGIIKSFFIFYERLITENRKYNLTSITHTDEVIVKHFIDSVVILNYVDIPCSAKIIDIGTGAGFPGLPLYIMRNDIDITFLDSSAKKIKFIENTAKLMNLSGLNFICGRAEDIAKGENRAAYDFAVSRAVAKLNILCELAAPLVRKGGYYIAYKGKNAEAEITEAANAIKILGLEIAAIHKFNIETTEDNITEENKRALIIIKKIKNTVSIYPRNYAEIIKNPL